MFEDLDRSLKNFEKYETIFVEMADVLAESKFKDELAITEQWFKVLSEPERTALVYTLLQQCSQEQMQFFSAVLQQTKPEDGNSVKPKLMKAGVRPPDLNLPLPHSSAVADLDSASMTQDSAVLSINSRALDLPERSTSVLPSPRSNDTLHIPAQAKNWASMVNTPDVPMFQKSDSGSVGSKGPGLAAINASTLNLLATSGLSNDAQLLAVQLVMNGILQPVDTSPTVQKQGRTSSTGKGRKQSHGGWRSESSSTSKYPSSVLRSGSKSGVPKSGGSKNFGLASNGLDSTSNESPQVEDFDPELLNDISVWLKSLRLHKYTSCFEGMTWREMVVMDDAALEKMGVVVLGARRRLLQRFDRVRREMGMEPSTIGATPTTSTVSSNAVSSSGCPSSSALKEPQSAASNLSVDSPVFMPTGKLPQSNTPTLQPAANPAI